MRLIILEIPIKLNQTSNLQGITVHPQNYPDGLFTGVF